MIKCEWTFKCYTCNPVKKLLVACIRENPRNVALSVKIIFVLLPFLPIVHILSARLIWIKGIETAPISDLTLMVGRFEIMRGDDRAAAIVVLLSTNYFWGVFYKC